MSYGNLLSRPELLWLQHWWIKADLETRRQFEAWKAREP
jgi:hypothetical protein